MVFTGSTAIGSKAGGRGEGVGCGEFCRHENNSQMLHVWIIYLHWVKNGHIQGEMYIKYSLHGAFGIGMWVNMPVTWMLWECDFMKSLAKWDDTFKTSTGATFIGWFFPKSFSFISLFGGVLYITGFGLLK